MYPRNILGQVSRMQDSISVLFSELFATLCKHKVSQDFKTIKLSSHFMKQDQMYSKKSNGFFMRSWAKNINYVYLIINFNSLIQTSHLICYFLNSLLEMLTFHIFSLLNKLFSFLLTCFTWWYRLKICIWLSICYDTYLFCNFQLFESCFLSAIDKAVAFPKFPL